jgi:acyl-CoA synthetase (AMP-forming)/AMP-acid ligase II
MNSSMQKSPLNLAYILEHAARFHQHQQVVSRMDDGSLHRYTYAEALKRAKQLANALQTAGIETGDRVATLAWNDYRHFESWYGIVGQGAVCHTVNPRLFADQLKYIINHAQDKIILIDLSFVLLLETIQAELPSVQHYILLCDVHNMPETSLPGALSYEEFISAQSEEFDWAIVDEEQPSSLCYTSGTTGVPKGVLYSHRSNLLMAQAICGSDAFALSSQSSVLAVVPLFHANSWGLVYSAPMVGAKLVLPGRHLDGPNIYDIIKEESVSFSAAVPTVWNSLLVYLRENALNLPTLNEVVVGGSAVPPAMIKDFQNDYGVNVLHTWGMTEISPVGSINRPTSFTLTLSKEQQFELSLKQGRPLFGVEMSLRNDAGENLLHDGKSAGRLFVKGPWVIEKYYLANNSALEDGWFDTGDIATIDEYGLMNITDRAKDIIKSGGEWISSVELENAAMSHADISLAAVIGIPDLHWGERPLLLATLARSDIDVSVDGLRQHLAGYVANWWLPEKILFVDEIPLTATGKINKLPLREMYSNKNDNNE